MSPFPAVSVSVAWEAGFAGLLPMKVGNAEVMRELREQTLVEQVDEQQQQAGDGIPVLRLLPNDRCAGNGRLASKQDKAGERCFRVSGAEAFDQATQTQREYRCRWRRPACRFWSA